MIIMPFEEETRALFCLKCKKEIARSRLVTFLNSEMHRHNKETGHPGYEEKIAK